MWSLAADYFLFHHLPTASSMVGAAAIVCGGLLVAMWRMHTGFDASSRGGGANVSQKEQLAILRM